MKTIDKTPEEIKKVMEYSEDKKKLLVVLDSLDVYHSEPKYECFFEDDKKKNIFRNVYTVILSRGKKKIKFRYGDSVNNTHDGKTTLDLYSVLCVVGSEYFCPETFEDFCSEFGYSEDSRSAEKLFLRLKKMSEKLHNMFSEDEANAMPR